MARRSVEVNNLRAIRYDAQRRVLEIQFHAGGIYQYLGVPAEVYRQLLAAEQPKKYYERYIKHKYPERHVLIV